MPWRFQSKLKPTAAPFTAETKTVHRNLTNPCISLIPARSVDLHTRKKWICSSSGRRLWKATFPFYSMFPSQIKSTEFLDPRAQSPIAQLFRLLLCYIPIPTRRQCAWRPIMVHRAFSLDGRTGWGGASTAPIHSQSWASQSVDGLLTALITLYIKHWLTFLFNVDVFF